MDAITKCLHIIVPLIKLGEINGIDLAERAIDEFLDAHYGARAQSGALHVLEASLPEAETGQSLEFLKTVHDYIYAKMRTLENQ
jgi:hypothetical protein